MNRLQNFKDPEDEVVKVYRLAMQTDESETARTIATSLCGLNRRTLFLILDR